MISWNFGDMTSYDVKLKNNSNAKTFELFSARLVVRLMKGLSAVIYRCNTVTFSQFGKIRFGLWPSIALFINLAKQVLQDYVGRFVTLFFTFPNFVWEGIGFCRFVGIYIYMCVYLLQLDFAPFHPFLGLASPRYLTHS